MGGSGAYRRVRSSDSAGADSGFASLGRVYIGQFSSGLVPGASSDVARSIAHMFGSVKWEGRGCSAEAKGRTVRSRAPGTRRKDEKASIPSLMCMVFGPPRHELSVQSFHASIPSLIGMVFGRATGTG